MKRLRNFLANEIGYLGALASIYGRYGLGAKLNDWANWIGAKKAASGMRKQHRLHRGAAR